VRITVKSKDTSLKKDSKKKEKKERLIGFQHVPYKVFN
jgi:hypothetical protein